MAFSLCHVEVIFIEFYPRIIRHGHSDKGGDMAVLILGGHDDEHAVHMLDHLRAAGADAEMLDSRLFPTDIELTYNPAAPSAWLKLADRRLEFDEITAVYWRLYHGFVLPPLADFGQAQIAQNDTRSLFESLLVALPARWVNGWKAFQSHQIKPVQLAQAAALGVPVPATLVSNDGEAIRHFVARHPKSIFKPVQGGAHARRVTPRHLESGNLESLGLAPVTIQEEIPGESVRVFVAAARVLACRLGTEELDYRDDPAPRIEPVELPLAVAEACVKVARRLDLLWTGIDLRHTPDDRYVFLEANPSPMFLGFERRTGLPLTASLAELLLADTLEGTS